MKLRDIDVLQMMEFFEDAMNRSVKLERQRKIQLRRKIRNELYSLMGWELATPEAVMSRWEDRLYDVFMVLPYGFKDDLFRLLVDKLRVPLYKRDKKGDASPRGPQTSGTPKS